MSEKDIEEIRNSAEEIVDSFTEAVEDLPQQDETYYGQDTTNEFRDDARPKGKGELERFRKNFLRIMPSSDEDGNLEVEVAEWT